MRMRKDAEEENEEDNIGRKELRIRGKVDW